MGWFIPIAMAVASVGQGLWGNSVARKNASATRAWAKYNAAQAIKYSNFNANAIEQVASINSMFVGATAEINAKTTKAVAQYNATIRVQTAEYNAQLLEKEAELVWSQQELDQIIFWREAEYRQKNARAKFATNGVEINTGSPVDFIIDQATQAHLESFIIRHNADIEIGKLLDAAALGRWEGEAEAASMIYQAKMEALSTTTQAELSQFQINAQAAYDAVMTRYSGLIEANQILQEGEWQASQYEQEGLQNILTGIFQGASWASKGFKFNSSSGTNALSTTRTTPYGAPA